MIVRAKKFHIFNLTQEYIFGQDPYSAIVLRNLGAWHALVAKEMEKEDPADFASRTATSTCIGFKYKERTFLAMSTRVQPFFSGFITLNSNRSSVAMAACIPVLITNYALPKDYIDFIDMDEYKNVSKYKKMAKQLDKLILRLPIYEKVYRAFVNGYKDVTFNPIFSEKASAAINNPFVSREFNLNVYPNLFQEPELTDLQINMRVDKLNKDLKYCDDEFKILKTLGVM